MKPRHRKNKITPADIPGHMFSGNGQGSVNDKKNWKMKPRILFASIMTCAAIAFLATGCGDRKTKPHAEAAEETSETADTTVYGVCGEGTSMHSLQLVTDYGDTVTYAINDEGEPMTDVQGGLMAGDHVAVVGTKHDGEMVADRVINLTSLLGHWTSIDRNFELEEGGTVKSSVKAETAPWTTWKIFNGNLVLNRDTFVIYNLGADSLYIENDKGIYAFKRQY